MQRVTEVAEIASAQPLLGVGSVRHRRLRPAAHAFTYPTFFLLLPMRRLRTDACAALQRNRFAGLSFHDADHGDGGPDSLAWLESLLAREGVADADGEVWLQTYPRVFGHVFKPVSFWYCERRDGRLAAVVVEVNNTFGERHCYLLDGAQLAWGQTISASKVFYVSPFCRVEGSYRFRFMRTAPSAQRPARLVACIEHWDADGLLLLTSQSGALQALTRAAAWRAFARMPFITLSVVARIHWQALCLWCKGVPFVRKSVHRSGRKPETGSAAVSR